MDVTCTSEWLAQRLHCENDECNKEMKNMNESCLLIHLNHNKTLQKPDLS
jgi:hypothetical protein